MRVCLFVLCGHLLGKGWPLGSRLWCLTVKPGTHDETFVCNSVLQTKVSSCVPGFTVRHHKREPRGQPFPSRWPQSTNKQSCRQKFHGVYVRETCFKRFFMVHETVSSNRTLLYFLLALVCGVFCEFVTLPLVSWVGCGTWLYQLLIFAPLLTFILILAVAYGFGAQLIGPIQLHVKRQNSSIFKLFLGDCLDFFLPVNSKICHSPIKKVKRQPTLIISFSHHSPFFRRDSQKIQVEIRLATNFTWGVCQNRSYKDAFFCISLTNIDQCWITCAKAEI